MKAGRALGPSSYNLVHILSELRLKFHTQAA